MKTSPRESVTATFVSAVLSLILPASAMATNDAPRPRDETVQVERPMDERDAREAAEAARSDPVLDNLKWGPGNPDLVVSRFHLDLSAPPKPRPRDRTDKPPR